MNGAYNNIENHRTTMSTQFYQQNEKKIEAKINKSLLRIQELQQLNSNATIRCKSLDRSPENILAKKYTFNPLSKPFHPANSNNMTSNINQQNNICFNLPSQVHNHCIESNACERMYCDANSSPYSPAYSVGENIIETIFQDARSNASSNENGKSKGLPFICILCPSRHRTLDDLQNHITQKVLKPYDCVVCGEVFTHKYALQRHMGKHRNKKSFTCRGCYKKFRNFGVLNKHFDVCRFKLYIFTS